MTEPVRALTQEEGRFVEQLLYMTGREDRLSRELDPQQIEGVRAIWPCLKSSREPRARCDLLNRLLLTLGIKTISSDFFDTVFQNLDLSDTENTRERVDRFRSLCMLEFGSFRYGYRQFRQGAVVRERWREYFPLEREIAEREERLKSRPEPVGLIPIPADQLFSLGYLAGEHAPRINEARSELKRIIDSALKASVADFRGLREAAKKCGAGDLTMLLGRVGVPGAETVICCSDLPLFGGTERPYCDVLRDVAGACVTVEEEAIRSARQQGLQNSRTYMAMHDLDVYVATSMRDPLHFTSNSAFVQRLFHSGALAQWRLRYFDPTQAYLEDRIQKGLLECLMIKRARVTVYNAQEEDTFGKDAEAGVTLAQRKPVIVYVARLFENHPELQRLYRAIDQGARIDRNAFVGNLADARLLDPRERDSLLAPERTKADAISAVLDKYVPEILDKVGEDVIAAELIRQGYRAEPKTDIIQLAEQRIRKLERRALTFRDIHPLSLQTSPMDGVARGIIVTRTVEDTAAVLRGLLLGTLEYEIDDDDNNWLLVDRITRSPVRVVTKDPVLTTAFWDEDWTGAAERENTAR